MSRLAERFGVLRQEGRAALIPYITAGDPAPDVTVPLLHALVSAGADVLELGVPFSEPMADGPVIQAAHERAVTGGTGLRRVLEIVREFRRTDQTTPVVLMGYMNPVEVMGWEVFAAAAADAGVDGVLTVDMPPEEAETAALRHNGLDPVFLVAPNSSDERIRQICEAASGFVYYVSLKGVTGSESLDTQTLAAQVERIRGATELPVGVGFGIRTPELAAQVAGVADAVVVGSALVRLIAEKGADREELLRAASRLVQDMRRAMDGAR